MDSGLTPFEPAVEFSVLLSCYFEEKSIDEFYSRLSSTMQSLGRSYELIFVNDGSTDRTFELLKRIFETDRHVSAVVDLVKNAGQSNAKTPSLMLARGKAMILIDTDLQLDPEDLPALVQKYDEGYDVVSGYRVDRRDPLSRTLPSRIANAIMRKASSSNLRDFGCTFKIYDGRLVRAFEFGPFKPWRPAPVIAQAQRIAEVPVRHHARPFGTSGWTFRKLFAYNMENIVNLSDKPFQILALICFSLALLFTIRISAELFFPISILPRATNGLILNVIVITSLTILSVLAVIGEFVVRSFVSSQKKPAFIVRDVLRREVETTR